MAAVSQTSGFMSEQDHNRQHYNPDPHTHPGLHLIAVVEGVKGVLALLAASGLAVIGPAPLQRWAHALIARFQLDPEHGAMAWLAQSINPGVVHFAAFVVLLYGILHIIEGWGLWRAKAWASILGCITAALYLPFDVYAFASHRHWLEGVVVIINLIVVWVLAHDLLVRRR
ncbi:MAG: DUF2127 domain-containing protein [Thermomonas sp.]